MSSTLHLPKKGSGRPRRDLVKRKGLGSAGGGGTGLGGAAEASFELEFEAAVAAQEALQRVASEANAPRMATFAKGGVRPVVVVAQVSFSMVAIG